MKGSMKREILLELKSLALIIVLNLSWQKKIINLNRRAVLGDDKGALLFIYFFKF